MHMTVLYTHVRLVHVETEALNADSEGEKLGQKLHLKCIGGVDVQRRMREHVVGGRGRV